MRRTGTQPRLLILVALLAVFLSACSTTKYNVVQANEAFVPRQEAFSNDSDYNDYVVALRRADKLISKGSLWLAIPELEKAHSLSNRELEIVYAEAKRSAALEGATSETVFNRLAYEADSIIERGYTAGVERAEACYQIAAIYAPTPELKAHALEKAAAARTLTEERLAQWESHETELRRKQEEHDAALQKALKKNQEERIKEEQRQWEERQRRLREEEQARLNAESARLQSIADGLASIHKKEKLTDDAYHTLTLNLANLTDLECVQVRIRLATLIGIDSADEILNKFHKPEVVRYSPVQSYSPNTSSTQQQITVTIPSQVKTPANTSSTYTPRVAENGSYYGERNSEGRPKTVHVDGYYRKDGTYVRGHYRSTPRK